MGRISGSVETESPKAAQLNRLHTHKKTKFKSGFVSEEKNFVVKRLTKHEHTLRRMKAAVVSFSAFHVDTRPTQGTAPNAKAKDKVEICGEYSLTLVKNETASIVLFSEFCASKRQTHRANKMQAEEATAS